jgi:hypothetical protein
VTFENLEKNPEKYLVPLEEAFRRIGVKKIFVKEDSVHKILNGSPVLAEYAERKVKIKPGEIVGIFSGRKLIALGTATGEKSIARTDRIFKG